MPTSEPLSSDLDIKEDFRSSKQPLQIVTAPLATDTETTVIHLKYQFTVK